MHDNRLICQKGGVRVLIAAGGSGGHIFPAIALARTLKDRAADIDIRFVGGNKALDKRIFEKEGFSFSVLSSNKLPDKASWGLVVFFVKLAFDIINALSILLSHRPDVVVGFGGYVSFPIIFSASVFGIPKILHEQNVSAGRANKFLFRFADKIAISFKETGPLLGPYARKIVFTGNPIRQEMFRGDKALGITRFGLDARKFTILVMGGSQGAHFLNETFIRSLAGMVEASRRTLQVIHITGIKDYEWAMKEYDRLRPIEARVYSFIDRIEEAYSASDLVVTRSGASAIFELAFFAKAMILVPYPFANAHQAENAQIFFERGAAIKLDERSLSVGLFKDTLLSLLNDKDRLKRIGESARALSIPDASSNLAYEVLKLT